MVEADYPNSPFRVGQILEYRNEIRPEFCDYGTGCSISEHDAKTYPKIFRLMHWSEQREFSEMQRYLRFIHSPEYVLRVGVYIAGRVSFVGKQGTNKIEWYAPATEAEYLEYLKSKEK